MPLYKTITVTPNTKVLIWKIEESFETLSEGVTLTTHCENRVNGMKSDLHRRGFMSVRKLLAIEGYTDHDLFYDLYGKPHLNDNKHISITHSFTFAAVIISDIEVGIDIEMQRSKILKIAHKFTPIEGYSEILDDEIKMRKLTMVWGAKESLFKSFARPGLSFIQHIYVDDFDLKELETVAIVRFMEKECHYKVWFVEFEGFTCAFALLYQGLL